MAKLQHIDTMINLLIDGWLRRGENLVKGLLMAGRFSPAGQRLRAWVCDNPASGLQFSGLRAGRSENLKSAGVRSLPCEWRIPEWFL
jgi:hypothetical protein